MRAAYVLLVASFFGCAPPIGETCSDDGDCGSASCQARWDTHIRQCVSDCGPDAPNCPAGECVGYVCALPCGSDAECPKDTVCGEPSLGFGAVCLAACVSDDDCREATPVCNAGRCEPDAD